MIEALLGAVAGIIVTLIATGGIARVANIKLQKAIQTHDKAMHMYSVTRDTMNTVNERNKAFAKAIGELAKQGVELHDVTAIMAPLQSDAFRHADTTTCSSKGGDDDIS